MATNQGTTPVRGRPWTERPLWQIGLGAALVAAVASVMVYIIARAAGVPMELTEVFEHEFRRMPVLNMAWAALLDGGVTGTVVAMACRRWAKRPRSSFVALTTVGLIASLTLPIVSDASTATKVVLSISHVVVAIIIVPPLALALPRRTRRRDDATTSVRSEADDYDHSRSDRDQQVRQSPFEHSVGEADRLPSFGGQNSDRFVGYHAVGTAAVTRARPRRRR